MDKHLCAQADDGTIYAYEVSDAVEADSLGYEIDGVLVSDFVTPKWFQPSAFGSSYSFKNNVSASFQLAKGGYISVFDPQKGWTQVHGGEMARFEESAPIPEGSRRHRRMLGRAVWRKSVTG